MLKFIKKHLNKQKKTESNEKNTKNIKAELIQAEKKAKTERLKVHNIKAQIYNAAADIIHEIFDVPAEFWYEELVNYESIKNDSRNSGITKSLVMKCDQVIEGYYDQLKITKSKIAFYDKLNDEYKKLYHS